MHFKSKIMICSLFIPLSVLIAFNGVSYGAGKKKSSQQNSSAPAASKEAIVATVNGTAITRLEFDRTMKMVLAMNNITQPIPEDQKKTIENQVLKELISAELFYQEGKKYAIPDIDAKVEKKIADVRAKYPSKEAYDKAQKQTGITDKDLREFARKELYIENLIEKEIASKVTVSEADAKKFYDENPDKFKQGESVRISHILVKVDPKASMEEKKAAREKADAALKRIKSGEDFASVAKQESADPSASEGGDLGYITKGQNVPPFMEKAFSMNVGDMSDLVATEFGYLIIKVTDKKPPRTLSYDETKQKIMEFLKFQQIQKSINDLGEKLRKNAKVEIFLK
jgi:peptidyl-prolyl cis-trans isomerase C